MKKCCDICGSEFEAKTKRQRLCSDECRRISALRYMKARRDIERVKKCEWCGKDFSTKNPHRKFCSVECARLMNKMIAAKKATGEPTGRKTICVVCGREFIARHAGQKYCCKECHEAPLAKSLRRFFVKMFERFNLDTANFERVMSYDA